MNVDLGGFMLIRAGILDAGVAGLHVPFYDY